MSAVVLGDADDVRGFALAGVRGYVCRDLAEAHATLADIATHAADIELVLVSPAVARLAAGAIERLRRLNGGPAVIILPQPADSRRTSSALANGSVT